MSTRQKLTLGIAAIFMVTLTIIGVTYAYFVTRVDVQGTETKAEITTADVSITYGDGNSVVSMNNVVPGTTVYKTFTVTNNSTIAVPFAVKLSSFYEEGKPQFVHTFAEDRTSSVLDKTADANLIAECYVSTSVNNLSTDPAASDCYSGTKVYDNITVTLHRLNSTPTNVEDFNGKDAAKIAALITGGATEVQATRLAPYFNTDTSSAVVGSDFYADLGSKLETVGAGATSYYVLTVSYVNNGVNQNIENEAAVNFRVDIAESFGKITNE